MRRSTGPCGLFGMEISRADHLTTFDGLPTKRKLEMLTVTDGLPKELHRFLNDLKQAYTLEICEQPLPADLWT